jgi:hypothetical protein
VGPADWRRDCGMIRDTGFNIIRIRIGQDSNLDEVAELLDIAHGCELDVLSGFATFYASRLADGRSRRGRLG